MKYILASIAMVAILATIAFLIYRRKQNKVYMSFKESLDLTSVPIITFINNGNKYNFIIDTGCSTSVIHSKILDDVKAEITTKEVTTFAFDANDRNNNKLCFVDFKARTKNNNLKNFHILFQSLDMTHLVEKIKQEKGVEIHGLLGNSFFEYFKYVIDFNKLIIYSKCK